MKDRILKDKIKAGNLSIGSWITLANTAIVEIMSKAGFDWLAIDMEHSAITLNKTQELVRVVELSGITPLVRIGSNDANLIKRVMDMGAYGVIVPMVNSKNDALKAVDSVKYPPLGSRGVGLARAQGYGLDFEGYKKWVNSNSIVVVQIEHIRAIDNLEEILKIKDIDASIIGPYDLSASMGYPGEFERKEVKNVIKEYMRVCKKLNKSAGFHVISPNAGKVNDKIRQGFTFLGFSLDTLFLGVKIQKEWQRLKGKKQ